MLRHNRHISRDTVDQIVTRVIVEFKLAHSNRIPHVLVRLHLVKVSAPLTTLIISIHDIVSLARCSLLANHVLFAFELVLTLCAQVLLLHELPALEVSIVVLKTLPLKISLLFLTLDRSLLLLIGCEVFVEALIRWQIIGGLLRWVVKSNGATRHLITAYSVPQTLMCQCLRVFLQKL